MLIIKTIDQLNSELKACKYSITKEGAQKRREIPSQLKKDIINTMMKHGFNAPAMSEKLENIHPQNINRWIKKFRSEPTNKVGYLHGSRPRMDVATQCVAVKKKLEQGATLQGLGEEFHVSPQTINNWVNKYKYTYQHYIDTLEPGVVSIKDDNKLIFGSVNISKIVKYKEEQVHELEMVFKVMHKYGLDDSAQAIVQAEQHQTENEISILKNAFKIIDEATIE